MVKAGEKIVCSLGHVCGELLIDVESGDSIVAPDNKSNGLPFKMYATDRAKPTGHRWVCAICDEEVARLHNSTWRIKTSQGCVGG